MSSGTCSLSNSTDVRFVISGLHAVVAGVRFAPKSCRGKRASARPASGTTSGALPDCMGSTRWGDITAQSPARIVRSSW